MYGNLTYSDVVNQITSQGWEIESQTPDSTLVKKQIGAPALAVIPLALIPVVGLGIALAWIAVAGYANVTIERKLSSARIHTPSNEYDVENRESLEMFFTMHDYRRNVGYFPVVMVGVAVIFIGALIFQFV